VTAGIAVDRVYHFHRFGDWTSTYAGLYSQHIAEVRAHSPVPLDGAFNDPAYPWTTPVLDGVISGFVSPRWGLLWFDGMALLAAYLFARFFRRWDRIVWIWTGTAMAYLAVYLVFYGRYYEPGGGPAWGDRYAEVPLLLLSLLGVFMAAQSWRWQTAFDRTVTLALSGAAAIVQIASGVFYYGLEAEQLYQGCGSRWTILQRLHNIATLLQGRAPNSDCVRPNSQWMWDPYVFPAALARTALRGPTGRLLLWSAWTGGLIVVLLLAGWLLALWRQSASAAPLTGAAPEPEPQPEPAR
jgi:hypothetical protein